MRKLLLASVAILALGAAAPVYAQNANDEAQEGAVIGGTAGAATGGTIGFFLGGPVGAIIGGFAGATLGAQAGVDASTVEYSSMNPVDPVFIEGDLDVGYVVPADVEIHAVPDDDQFGYIYANNRVYIVDLNSRAVVQSPGFVIEAQAVDFVKANPVDDVDFSGELAAGATIDVDLMEIPDNNFYGYVYVDGRPVLVERGSRTIVWVG
jgi:hypothetical protein